MIEFLSQLIVFNYKVMCTIKYIGNSIWDGTDGTDRGGYRSPSAGTSDLKIKLDGKMGTYCCNF